MKVIVGTSPKQLPIRGNHAVIIQNLGPGALYLEHHDKVTVDDGIRLLSGEAYEFSRDIASAGGALFAVADAEDTDVRTMVVG